MQFLVLLFLLSALPGRAQDIRRMKAEDIVSYPVSPDTVYVINFWATWCAPCVQELPAFNQLYRTYKNKPVSILLVSLDFKDNYPWKLQGFVKRKNLLPVIGWLDETDPNEFIPKIERGWEGSIPATLFIRPMKNRRFTEGMVSYKTLAQEVDAMLK